MNSASQRPRNEKSAGLWNATSCWLIDWLRIVSIPPEQQIFPPWGGSFSDISAVPHFQQPGRGGNLRWGEQMAGSLLLSHTRTWLGHNITHISFRWSVSTWGESRLLVIHYRLVSENLFIAMVRRMENCTQSCLKAIARWVQFPLKLISFVTKAAPELERVRDVCWWKKKTSSFCLCQNKVFVFMKVKYF